MTSALEMAISHSLDNGPTTTAFRTVIDPE